MGTASRTGYEPMKLYIDGVVWFVLLLLALAWNASSLIINPIALVVTALACLRLAVVVSKIGRRA